MVNVISIDATDFPDDLSELERMLMAWETGGNSAVSAGRSVDRSGARKFMVGLQQFKSPAGAGQIGRFVIKRELGRGAFGIVLAATDPLTNREVALKVPYPHIVAADESRRQFYREAEIAALLEHPNIVTVFEAGMADGFPFIASALVPGPSLREWLVGRVPLNPRLAAQVIARLADATHHAHGRGILHRDIKPGNILISRPDDPANPEPKLADFGLARMTESTDERSLSGHPVGTSRYMSPEQASGHRRRIDVRSDVWGLGATLYEMLTGRTPCDGESDSEIRMKIIRGEITPPRAIRADLPRDIEAVCLKSLEASPDRRYPGAGELAEDLRRWLAGEPTVARPAGPLRQFGQLIRRRPVSTSLASLALAALATGIVALAYHNATMTGLNAQIRGHESSLMERNEALRREVYANRFRNIQSLAANGNRPAMLAALNELLPREDENDIRGWEWHHLYGLAHPPSQVLWKHEGMAHQVRFHPAEPRMISWGADGTVRIQDLQTDQAGPVWKVHSAEANDAVWSPDGRTLAVSSDAEGVALLNWPDGRLIARLACDHGKVFELLFVPGSPFLIGLTEKGPHAWDLETGEKWLARPPGLDTTAIEATNVDAGNPAILVGHRNGRIERYQVSVATGQTGAERLRFGEGIVIPATPRGPEEKIKQLAPFPGGQAAYWLFGGQAGFVGPGPGHRVTTMSLHRVSALLMCEDGKTGYAATANGSILPLSVPGRSQSPVWMAENDKIMGINCSRDGSLVATASRNGNVRLYRKPPGGNQIPLGADSHAARTGLVSGKPRIVLLRADREERPLSVEVWDFTKKSRVSEQSLAGKFAGQPAGAVIPLRLAVHPRGDRILLTDARTGEFEERSLPDLKPIRSWGSPRSGPWHDGAYSPDGRWFAAGRDDGVELWRLGETPVAELLPGTMHGPSLLRLAFSPDSRRLVWCRDGIELAIRNLEGNTDEAAIPLEGGRSDSRPLFSPSGNQLIVLSNREIVHRWSWPDRTRMRSISLTTDHMAFTPDGRRLVTTTSGTRQFWDLETGLEVFQISQPGGPAMVSMNILTDPGSGSLITSVRFQDKKTGAREGGALLVDEAPGMAGR